MRVLIVGSGGREHALAWKLAQSPLVTEIFCAPGNGGTAQLGRNVPIADSDIDALLDYIRREGIDFVVPGPEGPLVRGLVDACIAAGVPCFGPSAYCAQLEGSKSFAKEVMRASNVPTADFAVFTDAAAALAHIESRSVPMVVKADGLAAGKGVVVAATRQEAKEAVNAMMVRRVFGAAGDTVLIEDALAGEEVSFLCLCASSEEGETVLPLPSAQDHKAAFDGDTGPNTGGMGAYSPAPLLPASGYEAMVELVIRPILRTLKERGHPFTGVLYAGLMMTAEGPMVLEYNTRFGDPECQPLLMRLESDLMEPMLAACRGELAEKRLVLSENPALCVVVTAKGYPGDYPKGMAISGIEAAEALAHSANAGANAGADSGAVTVFQASTRLEDGVIRSSGGRVLGVTATASTLAEAQTLAYQAADAITMENKYFRRDIGAKALRG